MVANALGTPVWGGAPRDEVSHSDLNALSNGVRKAALVATNDDISPAKNTATSSSAPADATGARPPRSRTARAIATRPDAAPIARPQASSSRFSATTTGQQCPRP